MKSKEIISINKMIEYIDRAMLYTKEHTLETFSEDIKTVDATVFVISQLGELVINIEEETRKKYPHIPWRTIKGIRNRIVHDYEGIILDMIWHTVKHDLIELKDNLNDILEK